MGNPDGAQWLMNQGRAVFSQLISLPPGREFRRCVERHLSGRQPAARVSLLGPSPFGRRQAVPSGIPRQGGAFDAGRREQVARLEDLCGFRAGVDSHCPATVRDDELASISIKVCTLWIRRPSICVDRDSSRRLGTDGCDHARRPTSHDRGKKCVACSQRNRQVGTRSASNQRRTQGRYISTAEAKRLTRQLNERHRGMERCRQLRNTQRRALKTR